VLGRPRLRNNDIVLTTQDEMKTLVLFLGDSLVSGVGGQCGVDGPMPAALPSEVASRLADRVGNTVHWASVGFVGAGVPKIFADGLPQLQAKIAELGEDAARVVIVLVVGTNDLRQLNLTYRLDLRRLVSELERMATGNKVVEGIFLPAVPFSEAPMLQVWPLRGLLLPVFALWEREKRKAISWAFGCVESAEVLACPAAPRDMLDKLFSSDRMHPNRNGYEWWAENLAQQIFHRLYPQLCT